MLPQPLVAAAEEGLHPAAPHPLPAVGRPAAQHAVAAAVVEDVVAVEPAHQ